jgi:hypothetical protein
LRVVILRERWMRVAVRGRSLLSYTDLKARVQANHPLRAIREITKGALAVLSRDFAALYSGLTRIRTVVSQVLHEISQRSKHHNTASCNLKRQKNPHSISP